MGFASCPPGTLLPASVVTRLPHLSPMTHFPASCVTKIESQLGNLLLSSGHEGMKPQAEVRSGELWGAGTPSLFFPLWAAPSLDPVIAMVCRVVTEPPCGECCCPRGGQKALHWHRTLTQRQLPCPLSVTFEALLVSESLCSRE